MSDIYNGRDAKDQSLVAGDSGDESAASVASDGVVDDALGPSVGRKSGQPAGEESREQRHRFADERTNAMSVSTYGKFSLTRRKAKLHGRQFHCWCKALLKASRLQLPAGVTELNFLGWLATMHVVKLVEAANRMAHGGKLCPPLQPLIRSHYELALSSLSDGPLVNGAEDFQSSARADRTNRALG